MADKNMSVVRVERITMGGIQKAERHNERKNESYANVNVDTDRSHLNVHYSDTGGMTYTEYFNRLVEEKKVSTRGLKADATLFNELVIDVNTRYFEEHGGYEYAREFFRAAYEFCRDFFGEENIVSAVMHADERNLAVSEELGRDVYHYHLHVIAIPTVRKEVLWTKRCKDPALVGTVKEVIQQVSHSKKWVSDTPLLDEQGKPVLDKRGKPVFRKSYSVLQDALYEHLRAAGFRDFDRGQLGSTAEHLSSLDYQIQQDKERLAAVEGAITQGEERLDQVETAVAQGEDRLADVENAVRVKETKLARAQAALQEERKVAAAYSDIESAGEKTITGKYAMTKGELDMLRSLAKEGVASRGKISGLQNDLAREKRYSASLSGRLEQAQEKLRELTEKYERLAELTRPFIAALQRFPDRVRRFFDGLFSDRETEPKHEPEQRQPVKQKHDRDKGAR